MEKAKNKYIFPSKVAEAMKKVDLRTQLEASMLSTSLLVLGMFLYGVYLVIYGGMTWGQKAIIIFNLLCGIVLMGSSLITSYQQYYTFLDTVGIDTAKEKELVKKKGNIFKRIKLAFEERKKAKKAEKTLLNIDKLMEKSGIKNEASSDQIKSVEDENIE